MKPWLLALALLITLPATADFDTYTFPQPEQEQRYRALIDELRCVVCQGQTISGSNADVARNMRQKVYEQILAGRSDAEITQYMVDRYSDFVLYDPPFKPLTLLLWGGPALFLLIGIIVGWRVVQNRRRNAAESLETEARLDTERARRLLDEETP